MEDAINAERFEFLDRMQSIRPVSGGKIITSVAAKAERIGQSNEQAKKQNNI